MSVMISMEDVLKPVPMLMGVIHVLVVLDMYLVMMHTIALVL